MEIVMETPQKNYQEEELKKLAVAKIRKIKNFYTHLVVFAIGWAVYLLKTYYGMPFNFPPLHYLNLFVMGIWTFIIVLDGISVFMSEVIFGKKWEARKLEKLMKTKSKTQTWK